MAAVLIVEDNRETLLGFEAILRDAGFDVTQADTAAQALALAASRPFDAILADLRLPDLSAVEMLGRLRDQHISTPVVIVTGYGTIESAAAAMRVGAVDYLTKPVLADDLVASLRTAVAGTNAGLPDLVARDIERSMRDEVSAREVRQPTDPRVEDVMRFIDANLAANHSLHDLASHVGLSASRLRHLFTTNVGVSVARYRRNRRLEEAARLLLHSHDRISEIAYQVGYSDAVEFTKAFRRHFHLSPSEYRQR